jgi:hypothetical protein
MLIIDSKRHTRPRQLLMMRRVLIRGVGGASLVCDFVWEGISAGSTGLLQMVVITGTSTEVLVLVLVPS